MDLIYDSVDKLYIKFLAPAMGSAIVISIYSFVDTIAVGQSESELGAAAMAVILPFFSIMCFFAVFTGMGGAVLMSQAFGHGDEKRGKQLFTVSFCIMAIITCSFWALFLVLDYRLFYLFGADDTIMPKVMEYARWLIWFFPMFVLPNYLGCFIRNDKSPAVVMIAVLTGGALNIFGDWYFVFPMGLGMKGAAIATVMGTTAQVLVMLIHFFSPRNRLKFVRPHRFINKSGAILTMGFGAGILDLGLVISTCLMNNQLMKYGGSAQLAVYGVICTIAALWQALFSGVGNAVQPIAATNYGAHIPRRIKRVLKLGTVTVIILAIIFLLIGELLPTQTIKLFMTATDEVLAVAPHMTRIYSVWYIFLGINVLSLYYLQAISKVGATLIIAALRSAVLSTLFIFTLPTVLGIDGVMLALPSAEFITAIFSVSYILYINSEKYAKAHPAASAESVYSRQASETK